MQDETTPAERLDVAERTILYALASEDGTQSIWTVEELGREVRSLEDAKIAVRALHETGLIHQTSNGFIFATRAALRAVEMSGHVV